MPRPRGCRRIEGTPGARIFSPAGWGGAAHSDAVALSLEEYEAIRLADFEGLYQEEAAVRMAVSRQTFGRSLESAHRKIARALVEGRALRIGDASEQPLAAENAAGFTRRGVWEGRTAAPASGTTGMCGLLKRRRHHHHCHD